MKASACSFRIRVGPSNQRAGVSATDPSLPPLGIEIHPTGPPVPGQTFGGTALGECLIAPLGTEVWDATGPMAIGCGALEAGGKGRESPWVETAESL